MPGTAAAATLCDSLKAIVAANGRPAVPIAPEGWAGCAAEPPRAFLCRAGGGRPQATVQAHLYAVNAEIAACYGIPGIEPTNAAKGNERDFAIGGGVTIATYTEGFGRADGGIRLRIEFTHPS
jgi:hypothetical protein